MVISANYSRRPITTSCASASAVVGNLDWHPSDRVQLYLRTSYSKFTDNEPRDQNRLAVTGDSSGLIGTASILVRHRKEDGNTRSASLGGEFADVAGGKFEQSGGWTRATQDDPIRSEFTFTGAKGEAAIDYDGSTDPYTMAASASALLATPSSFAADACGRAYIVDGLSTCGKIMENFCLTESRAGLRGPLTAADHPVLLRSPTETGNMLPHRKKRG
ncbi:hypothetical protein [Novosphingobium clariflavum]|uniref:Uncharacterized protein n=1 Tax=Novosphingobium clariflavum TaxID=2029884 RepID=A0ABV6S747_9SPHN